MRRKQNQFENALLFQLYVPLNIFVALVGIVVWTESDKIELSNYSNVTLRNFLEYRRKTLVKEHPNDNAQLLTKTVFDGGVVGKAVSGAICSYQYSGGVISVHSPILREIASTLAHELGHNFGMDHDTADCKCVDENCIMSTHTSSTPQVRWSDCSIGLRNFAVHRQINYCLRNIPSTLLDLPVCGNGFVETGEECDCGLPESCKNSCCDPLKCKLRSNAMCATGNCCDVNTCRPRIAGTMCRQPIGECDLPEYCDGKTEFCPMDYHKRDAEECDGGRAFCYKGSCRTHDDQCKLLWGPFSKSSKLCYEQNLKGTFYGNCGYDRVNDNYIKCTKEDMYCGRLQCHSSDSTGRLVFGIEGVVAMVSHSSQSRRGSDITCKAATIDLGLDTVDPGLTPDGARCGDGKMCVNQKCAATDSIRVCPNNCSEHGVCDNVGNCHCDVGFAPPLCDTPGPGGSEHSGPASDSNGNIST